MATASRRQTLPPDYFTRVLGKYPTEKPIIIAETGWHSDDMMIDLNVGNGNPGN